MHEESRLEALVETKLEVFSKPSYGYDLSQGTTEGRHRALSNVQFGA